MKLALITGATGGLGRAIAALLAAKKIPLLLTARDLAALESFASTLRSQTAVECFAADLSKDIDIVLRAIENKAPDLVINNAGFGLYGPIVDLDSQDKMIDVDITALVLITQKTAQVLKAQNLSGIILNISSAASYFAMPYFATYSAAKAFVRIFSEAVDEELRNSNIRVLVSCPGQIDTPFAKHASRGFFKKNTSSMSPEKVAELLWLQIEKGKRCEVIDLRYRIAVALSYLIPKRWLQALIGASILKRIQK